MKYLDTVQVAGDSFFDGKRGIIIDYNPQEKIIYGGNTIQFPAQYLVDFGKVQKWFPESKLIWVPEGGLR